jgi:hypothetical protein
MCPLCREPVRPGEPVALVAHGDRLQVIRCAWPGILARRTTTNLRRNSAASDRPRTLCGAGVVDAPDSREYGTLTARGRTLRAHRSAV